MIGRKNPAPPTASRTRWPRCPRRFRFRGPATIKNIAAQPTRNGHSVLCHDVLASGGQEHHYKYGGPDRKSDPEPRPAHAYQHSERPKPERSPEDRIKQRCRPPYYLITPVTCRLHMANALKRPHCGSLSLWEMECIWHCWRKNGVSEAKTRKHHNILSGI